MNGYDALVRLLDRMLREQSEEAQTQLPVQPVGGRASSEEKPGSIIPMSTKDFAE